MIELKACPRCQGDLYEEEIVGERELVCLQCGSRTNVLMKHPPLVGKPTRDAKWARRRTSVRV